MGLLSRLLWTIGFPRQVNILFIGLDNSGKTTILQKLKDNPANPSEITPTIGFSVEKFALKKLNCVAFDMSGHGKYRDLWQHYFTETDAIVFVVDTSDKERASCAKEEFEGVLRNAALKVKSVPVLVMANKIDIAGGMTQAEVSIVLGLDRIRDRNWTIVASNALTGEGLQEAILWLTEQLKFIK